MSLRQELDDFFTKDAAGGLLLMASAVAAMIVANSPWSDTYRAALDAVFSVTLNGGGLSKPLILWINDGLMAVFFLLVGLELKYELMEGKLKNPRDIVLPGMAAIGGMAVPALIYAALNWGNPATIGGWAIPAATDIAFALGVLALLGRHAPPALKVFLLSLAILDDLGAIIIIALFYTADLQAQYLAMALVPIAGMFLLNRAGAHRVAPILLLGLVLWVLVLKSGVHATLAGVITAFFVPIKDRWGKSPLHSLEHSLSPYVLFGIVPIFAFANAGVQLGGLTMADLASPVSLGVAGGLVLGKLLGVTLLSFVTVKLGAAKLPEGVAWVHIIGTSLLAGIGFTMSLFIGGLSFADPDLMNAVRIGVLGGSAIAAIAGFTILRIAGSGSDTDVMDGDARTSPRAEPKDAPMAEV